MSTSTESYSSTDGRNEAYSLLRSQSQPQQPAQAQKQAGIIFTPDELRVLKECNRESFWKRSLPASMGSMVAVQLAVNMGYIKAHPTFGSFFKVVGAGFLGYMMGKISYQTRCREKLLQLENSPLADALRMGQSGREHYRQLERHKQQTAQVEMGSDKRGTDDYQGSADIESAVNESAGLDDGFRPSIDNDVYSQPLGSRQQEQMGTSYEELRSRNRSEYNKRFEVRQTDSDSNAPSSRPPLQPVYKPSEERLLETKNKYGDRWEK
ncbi:PREDICTED: OCIA domain-containing protein 1-like [Priapulus caudatus]|uniref:OCIA domain-containing protein 1-like n=1 Tax=Priapulus caudatus TaxID=37621 RepID=A0ABM1DTK6_PRICU|nr:PREDICTED: OCIA domain-containing protein 1-like [Priapulus caudatus]XP_014663277.1 PREDICTED: OCIA domain-containing protein 1-like [Priapulus caudatus]XP_014663278.1 PREDICTED: OCIA domain-containing protein 1-like [Priapulus caudatus]